MALDTLKAAPGALSTAICSIILAVKKRFLSLWRRLRYIFDSVTEIKAYTYKIST